MNDFRNFAAALHVSSGRSAFGTALKASALSLSLGALIAAGFLTSFGSAQAQTLTVNGPVTETGVTRNATSSSGAVDVSSGGNYTGTGVVLNSSVGSGLYVSGGGIAVLDDTSQIFVGSAAPFEGSGIQALGAGTHVTSSAVIVTANTGSGPSHPAGVISVDNALVDLIGGSVSTTGVSAYGLWGYGGTINSVVDITTSGGGSFGVVASRGGAVHLNGGTIATTGDGAIALLSDNISGLGAVIDSAATVRTSGTSSHGAWAFAGGVVNLTAGSVSTTGNNAFGYVANSSGSIINSSVDVTTSGNYAYGASAENGGVINLDGGVISTSGLDSLGVYTYAVGSALTANQVSIRTSNSGAHASGVDDGATLTVSHATLETKGADSNALMVESYSAPQVVSTARLTDVTLVSAQGASVGVTGGISEISLVQSSAVTNNGKWLDVSQRDPLQQTTTNILVDASRLQGTAVTTGDSFSHVTLQNQTQWAMTGDSNVTTLVNDGSTISYLAPTGDAALPSSYKTLTANNYTGLGGNIHLNAFLGTDNSPADKLVIDGGAATGSTMLLVSNTTGTGELTLGNGILLVETTNGATTDATAFRLGNRLAMGAYEYQLFYGGNADAGGDDNDQNWYLRNTLIPVPPEVPGGAIPIVRSEVIVATTLAPLAIEYGYAMLDSLHERVGETYIAPLSPVTEDRVVWCKDAAQNFKCVVRVPVATAGRGMNDETRWARSGWARLIGNRGFHDSNNFIRRGADYDYTLSAIQAGLDLFAHEQQDGTLDKAGIYVGYGQITSNVKGQFGGKAGSVDMDAYTVGGYWSHFSPNNWYTDAVVQGTWYTNTSSKSVQGMKISPDGFGILASLEGGYAFKFNNGWALEPQAQVVYQNVSFDNARDGFGTYRFNDGESLHGRLGLRLTKTWNQSNEGQEARLITAWLRGNIWHEFLGKTRTDVTTLSGLGGASFNSYLAGTWGEIGAGVTAQMTDKINIFATGAYNRSLDNKGREGWDGRLGMTVKW